MIETLGHRRTVPGNGISRKKPAREDRYVLRAPAVQEHPAGPVAGYTVSLWTKGKKLLRACRGTTLLLVVLWGIILVVVANSFFGFLWEFCFK